MTNLLTLQAPVEITAAAGGKTPPRVSIIAYSGGPMKPPGWPWVVVDLAGLELPGQVPLLSDHNNALSAIVGHATPRVDRGQLVAIGNIIPGAEAADRIVELAKGGLQFGASVGVEPLKTERVRPGTDVQVNERTITTADEMTIVRGGRLREITITAVGADPQASATIAASAASLKGNPMPDTNTPATPAFDPNLHAAWENPSLTASERVMARWSATTFADAAIRSECEGHLHAALSGSLTFPDFDRALLRAELRDIRLTAARGERPQAPAAHTHAGFHASGPEVLEAALLCHLGAEGVSAKMLGDQATQRGRELRATSLVEILQASFQLVGKEAPRSREQMIRAAFSTADIANIVSSAQNKMLLDQWQRLPLLSLQLTRQVPAKDFKQSKAVRLIGRASMFDQVGPAGEIAHGHLTDSASTFKVDTFARMYGITRQDIINDDLSAFDSMPTIIARGAGLKMESVFWSLVLANAASFFSEANGNLTDAPLDLDGLTAGVTLMRKMVDPDGEPILCEPKTLVVPPELEATADNLYASTNVVVAGTADAVTTTPSGNSVAGKYRPVATPYISNSNYTGNSTTKWFLFADRASGVAAFISAFLNGQTTPTIEQSDADFNTLGIQYRGYADFGFAQADPQGCVMSTGDGE